MPKELTHLVLAEAARKTFSEAGNLSGMGLLLKEHRAFYLFGAVMHDLAFCAPSGPAGDKVKAKGMAVHGNPVGNTLAPLIWLAAEYDKTGNPDILAMIAGAVSHMHADAVFHPFVYYYTGDEIARHYRLETLIDTYFYKNQKRWTDVSVSTLDLYKNMKSDPLAFYLTGFLDLSDASTFVLKKALRMHWFVLRFFRSRAGYYLFCVASLFCAGEFKSKTKLFYPAGMKFDTPFFDNDFFYKHPVTGEETTGCIDALSETVIKKACKAFGDISVASGRNELEKYFSGMSPFSLETGLDVSVPRAFTYTDLSISIDQLVSKKQLLHP